MAAMPPPPPPPPRILTVGIELEMAIFDGATLEAIVGVLEGAGVDAKTGPYEKIDPPGLWRVTEDRTISTAEMDVRQGDHDEWDVAMAAFGLPTDTPEPPHPQRRNTPESSSDEDGFTHITPPQHSSDDEQEVSLQWEETISDEETTPHIAGPVLRAEIISPPFEDDQGPKTERWLRDVRAVVDAIKNSQYRSEVNRTTGFHVHVSTGLLPGQGFTFEEVKKITAFYLACERRIDQLHPKSRHNNSHAQSNGLYSTYTDRTAEDRYHPGASVLDAPTLEALVEGTCPAREFIDDPDSKYTKYFKMNLAGLLDDHQTIEWRQHMGTRSSKKACRWVAFILAFVRKALTISPEELKKMSTRDKASIFDFPELRLAFFPVESAHT